MFSLLALLVKAGVLMPPPRGALSIWCSVVTARQNLAHAFVTTRNVMAMLQWRTCVSSDSFSLHFICPLKIITHTVDFGFSLKFRLLLSLIIPRSQENEQMSIKLAGVHMTGTGTDLTLICHIFINWPPHHHPLPTYPFKKICVIDPRDSSHLIKVRYKKHILPSSCSSACNIQGATLV